MDANLEREKSQAKAFLEVGPIACNVGDESKLGDLFATFLALEQKGKDLNRQKAELFASAKEFGLDRRAVQAAFRHRVREIDKPKLTAAHDALTNRYLIAIRSAPTTLNETQPSVTGHPLHDSGARGHAPAHAREDAPEAGRANPPVSKPASRNSSGVNQTPAEDDEPDIPDCSDSRKQSKQHARASGTRK
jgi:uncharacterized protein (UPF0335 family)